MFVAGGGDELVDGGPRSGSARWTRLIAVLGVIGVALVGLASQIGHDEYKERRAPQSAERADSLYQEYNGLGDTPRRASVFVQTGSEGSADDVRTVARHFHKLNVEFVSHRVTAAEARTSYGTNLNDWSGWFKDLGEGRSLKSDAFSKIERKNFVLLSAALEQIGGPAPRPTADSGTDAANDLMVTSNRTD
jgi:hypothetical protein